MMTMELRGPMATAWLIACSDLRGNRNDTGYNRLAYIFLTLNHVSAAPSHQRSMRGVEIGTYQCGRSAKSEKVAVLVQ